jgi:endonuclease/exonuclease/phosphatase family metal-dependent hydrolase
MSKEYGGKHSKQSEEKKKSPLRKVLRFIGILLLIIVAAVAGLIGFLTATEYKPADTETIAVEGEAGGELKIGKDFSIMSWNIGYGALGDNADFFMDGGKGVKTADMDRVQSNMAGVIEESTSLSPDIIFYQETDKDSTRSEHINEYEMLQNTFQEYCSSYANNFKVAFLPYPVPPIGKVDSGVATFSRYPVSGAERVQLPIPFSWPIRMANLKRCVLVSRIPLKDTDKELVLFNLHLEAYDSGEGKVAQTNMLAELIEAEAAKGNYVIAGGDFNQIFNTADGMKYAASPDKWQAGRIFINQFDGVWQFMMDNDVPSCRSLDQPYAGADKDNFQYYLIDGFIVSSNIRVKAFENRDLGFVVSDHNPAVMQLELRR